MEPNVLLVVLDSVRASNLHLYGHVARTTPFLDAFADETTVYTNARSPSIGSRPSHASLFTGYHAAETGVSAGRKLKPGTTIWEELLNEGYDTAVFSDNPFLRSNRYGFINGFETVKTRPENYVDVPFPRGLDLRLDENVLNARSGVEKALRDDAPVRSLLNGASVLLARRSPFLERWLGLHHDTSASTFVEAFDDWLADRDGPWAACLNLMDAHYPYDPDAEFDHWGSPILRELQDEWGESNYAKSEFHDGNRSWWQLAAFESLYDGSIRQLDAAVEQIVDVLDTADELEETLLVVTSDHGEGFGEQSYFEPDHRLVAHGVDGGIHDEQVHVPLLVKFAEQESGDRIEAAASLTMFPEVVRKVRNGSTDPGAFVPDGPVFVTLDAGYDRIANAVYEKAEDGIRMQIVDRSDAVTVVIRDPQNKYVESNRAPAASDQHAVFTDENVSVPQDADDVDPETSKRLRDLGYVQ